MSTNNLKLSECIRLGSTLGPQISGCFTSDDDGSCAIGAAFLAIGEREAIESYEGIDWLPTAARWFPSLAMPLPPDLRLGPSYADNVGEMIVHLNDSPAGLSREEIADFIVDQGWDCEVVRDAPAAQEVCASV